MSGASLGSFKVVEERVTELAKELADIEEVIHSLRRFRDKAEKTLNLVETLYQTLREIIAEATSGRERLTEDRKVLEKFCEEAEGIKELAKASYENLIGIERQFRDRLDDFAKAVKERATSVLAPFRDEVSQAIAHVERDARKCVDEFRLALRSELQKCKGAGEEYRAFIAEIEKAGSRIVRAELTSTDERLRLLEVCVKDVKEELGRQCEDRFKIGGDRLDRIQKEIESRMRELSSRIDRIEEAFDRNMTLLREWKYGFFVRINPFALLVRLKPEARIPGGCPETR